MDVLFAVRVIDFGRRCYKEKILACRNAAQRLSQNTVGEEATSFIKAEKGQERFVVGCEQGMKAKIHSVRQIDTQ